MGNAVRIVPLGKDVTAVIHVVSVALRAALIFGNVTPGDAGALMKYTFERVPAFVNAFKPLDDVVVACGAGAIALGFPVVTNETENIFRVPKSPVSYTHLDVYKRQAADRACYNYNRREDQEPGQLYYQDWYQRKRSDRLLWWIYG